MTSEYRRNHYVPEWYQRKFLLDGCDRYYRLDLKSDIVTSGGKSYSRKSIHEWSPKRIFRETDLYTFNSPQGLNVNFEKHFFGSVDGRSKKAVEYFEEFDCTDINEKKLHNFLNFMSLQKLRTPKGLLFLSRFVGREKVSLLHAIHSLQNIYCNIWSEAVWQIASAQNSDVKFIISDHPVTVYNRKSPPLSKLCKDHHDPDIRLSATHTYFPLSKEKVLILTNLNWARNPYQKELRLRPNPEFFRGNIFNFANVQFGRMLTEKEVLEINYVTKKRAFRYIAGGQREWLYPEKQLSKTNWASLEKGTYLCPSQGY